MKRLTASVLVLAMCLALCACGGENKASAMRLRKTEGNVWISDKARKDVPPAENLSLYGGYRLDTWEESFAWIDLDSVKLAKMDADSEISIQKEGKDLEIVLTSGRVFFRVTEPLEEDETMTIRTSDLMVGIRGTCGWVEAGDGGSTVGLLEGRVRCEPEEGERASVSAGEKGETGGEEGVTVSPLTVNDIPVFVVDELEADRGLYAQVLDELGIDVLAMRRLEGVYEGTYYPNQGESALRLTVEQADGTYRARFDFGSLPGRSNCKEGSYYMDVSYDPETELYTFIGTEWIDQPGGYSFVDLGGVLDGGHLSGDLYTRMDLWRVGTAPLPEPGETPAGAEPSEPEPAELPEETIPEPEPVSSPMTGCAGTYTGYAGQGVADLRLDASGIFSGGGLSYFDLLGEGMTPLSITENADGAVVIKYVDSPSSTEMITVYPPGVSPTYGGNALDLSMVNLEYYTYDGGVMSYYYYADPANLS